MKRGQRGYGEPRSNLVSNREERTGKALSAFRMVDQDSSSLIGGLLIELASTEEIPELREVPQTHKVFSFDPRLIHKRFNAGFIAGAKFGQLQQRIKHSELIKTEGTIDDASLGALAIGGDRRTVLVGVVSEAVQNERAAFYSSLAQVGVTGFTLDGKIAGQRNNKVPQIKIAKFAAPVTKGDEPDVLDVVRVGLDVQIGLSGGKDQLMLGPLQIRAHQPTRKN